MKNRIKKYPKEFWEKAGIIMSPKPTEEEIAESLQVWSQFPDICSEISELRDAYLKILEGFPEQEMRKIHKRYGHLVERLHEITVKIMILMDEDVEKVTKDDITQGDITQGE